MPDPFPQALRDFHTGEMDGPLRYRDGDESRDADVGTYFETYDPDDGDWLTSWLDGPLLDMGAGVGRHALYFQEHVETVAIEHHDCLVETMRDRGVRDARTADMFALPEAFARDRFASALAVGTQVGLCRSMQGLRRFLGDLAHVTAPDGTAVLDGFDPTHERTREMTHFRDDPTEGLAYRVIQFEYDGRLGEPWLYRLFTPDRVREAAVGTGWTVADVTRGDGDWDHLYRVALRKRRDAE